MKIGFVSSILETHSFEEVIDVAHELGYQCVELACWPKGDAERRYAGVSHIDVETLDEVKIEAVKAYCKLKEVEISALAYYPNTLDGDLEKRNANIRHLKKVISTSQKLGVGMVTTFIGRDQLKTVEENLLIFEEVWRDIIDYAEKCKVKIAIENCPMLFSKEQWPGGQNLATSPYIWDEMFKRIPSDYFGLNYDPSHMVWQMMDYVQPIYQFKDKLFHIHFKDIKVFKHQLDRYGIMAYPLDYMAPKLPGLGDVNWSKFTSALTDVGYSGYACVEIEDRAFEDSKDAIKNSLILSKRYLSQYVI
ncbi:sugar phosphate isomerase/epimerase family protein [Fusibacter bizertensis]